MTDRLRRVALVTIACCVLTSAAKAHNPPPSFAVRIEGRGPAMILIPGFLSSGERRAAIIGWTLGLTLGTLGVLLGMWY